MPSLGEDPREQVDLMILNDQQYNAHIEDIRPREYPQLKDTIYLDHAGTTIPAKSAIEAWSTELSTSLLGNPHSGSAGSQHSKQRVDDIRLQVLDFFKANPEDFDLIFTANATAAIKLVGEALRDYKFERHENPRDVQGFHLRVHIESHTSLIGLKAWARCDEGTNSIFNTDGEVQEWIQSIQVRKSWDEFHRPHELLAYPAQSNMTGRRLSLDWIKQLRDKSSPCYKQCYYTLLDAASLVSTSPLDLSDASTAPDFTTVSFYKIFGQPDLGALIVRKASAEVLMQKRYYAGGTMDFVNLNTISLHKRDIDGMKFRKRVIHEGLEEGTVPFHSIIALDHAIKVHTRLFGGMERVSRHTRWLAEYARRCLRDLRHANGCTVCVIYDDPFDGCEYGPIVSFNLLSSDGIFVSASEVEKSCNLKDLQIRSGTLCNPGGLSKHLEISIAESFRRYALGYRCGVDSEVIDGRPTGAIRISLGAMSTQNDIDRFTRFIEEYFIDKKGVKIESRAKNKRGTESWIVKSLAIHPIKSCASFEIEPDTPWPISNRGLEWDREWCLVRTGTFDALSQKQYPQLTRVCPVLRRKGSSLYLYVYYRQISSGINSKDRLRINLSNHSDPRDETRYRTVSSKVCGKTIPLLLYQDPTYRDWFTKKIGVDCMLARQLSSVRYEFCLFNLPSGKGVGQTYDRKYRLNNESPVSIINQASVDKLNQTIGRTGPSVKSSSFRANIVLGPAVQSDNISHDYLEDDWATLSKSTQDPQSSSYTIMDPDINSNASSESGYYSSSETVPISDDEKEELPAYTVRDETGVMKSTMVRPQISPLELEVLGPCQRCQMLCSNQDTGEKQQEPYSTLAKTRRKPGGRIMFGVHAKLIGDTEEERVAYIRVGDVLRSSVRKKNTQQVE